MQPISHHMFSFHETCIACKGLSPLLLEEHRACISIPLSIMSFGSRAVSNPQFQNPRKVAKELQKTLSLYMAEMQCFDQIINYGFSQNKEKTIAHISLSGLGSYERKINVHGPEHKSPDIELLLHREMES